MQLWTHSECGLLLPASPALILGKTVFELRHAQDINKEKTSRKTVRCPTTEKNHFAVIIKEVVKIPS